MQGQRRYASITEAAAYAGGVNPRTIRRMIARGEIVGYRFGDRMVRVDLNEIDLAMRPIQKGELDD